MAQMVKNLPAIQETQDQYLTLGDPPEKGMTTNSVLLPGEFYEIEEAGGLQSMGSQRVGHN